MRLKLVLCVALISLVFAQVANAGATYYADGYTGSPTASGQAYDPGLYTAATGTGIPLGSIVEVCRTDTGACVVVQVNDICACEIDLSRAAMAALDGIDAGVVPVTVTVL